MLSTVDLAARRQEEIMAELERLDTFFAIARQLELTARADRPHGKPERQEAPDE